MENYAEIASVQGLFRKRHAHKQHCKALVKSPKPKLKKALEAINKITTVQFDTDTEESQENEMFDADVADAPESSNILPEPTSDATSTSTQTAMHSEAGTTNDWFL